MLIFRLPLSPTQKARLRKRERQITAAYGGAIFFVAMVAGGFGLSRDAAGLLILSLVCAASINLVRGSSRKWVGGMTLAAYILYLALFLLTTSDVAFIALAALTAIVFAVSVWRGRQDFVRDNAEGTGKVNSIVLSD